MSWSGFKKNVGRATTQVMMKTGHVEKTSDRTYEVEERRYRTLESAALRLQKEAKGYLDSLRAMTASQMRIAETIDAFYGDSGASDGVSRSYKQAVEDLDAETVKALDGPYRCVDSSDFSDIFEALDSHGIKCVDNILAKIEAELNFRAGNSRNYTQHYPSPESFDEAMTLIEDICRTTVLEPINRFCAYFPDINECIKKRNHKMLDYDSMRSKVKKLVEKPDKDPSKLPRAEKEAEMVNIDNFFRDSLIFDSNIDYTVAPPPTTPERFVHERNHSLGNSAILDSAHGNVSVQRGRGLRKRIGNLFMEGVHGPNPRLEKKPVKEPVDDPDDTLGPLLSPVKTPSIFPAQRSTSLGTLSNRRGSTESKRLSSVGSTPPLEECIEEEFTKFRTMPRPRDEPHAFGKPSKHEAFCRSPSRSISLDTLGLSIIPGTLSRPSSDARLLQHQDERKSSSQNTRPKVHSTSLVSTPMFSTSELEDIMRPLKEEFAQKQTDKCLQAKVAYDQLNDQLTSELPQLIDLRVPYLDPSFEALVKIQLRFCAEAYSRMAQVQQYLDASTRDQYASGDLDSRVEEVLGQIRELSIAGTV